MTLQKEEKIGTGTLVLIWVLVLVIVSTFTYMIFFSGGKPTSTQTAESTIPDKYEMYAQGQRFVLQALKAPSTAEFPALAFEVIDLSGKRYKVVSYVDSQNSFGAMIRSPWTVIMATIGNKWILERMVVDGKVVYDPVAQEKSQAELDATIESTSKALEEARKILENTDYPLN